MAKRSAPEVNAGSMADIAFLLLIFFLVTTTIEKDSGMLRNMPVDPPENLVPPKIKQKNIFQVTINKNNGLFVITGGEEKVVELKDIRQMAIDFIDNGFALGNSENRCDYCQGKKKESSSDHPEKAIVSLKAAAETDYGPYIEVHNEIMAAYNTLRNRECNRLYKRDFTDLQKEYNDNPFGDNRDKLKGQVKSIQELYPLLFSEADPK
jgi:hypothetical protein